MSRRHAATFSGSHPWFLFHLVFFLATFVTGPRSFKLLLLASVIDLLSSLSTVSSQVFNK